jgi:streptogramin lyase
MRLSRHRALTFSLAIALFVPLVGVEAALTAGPAAATVTNFSDSTISGPVGITVGPDGALWFTNAGNSSVGSITTTGIVSNNQDVPIAQPNGIASGIDGNVWFTNEANNSIGQISIDDGTITRFGDPSISDPTGITAGPDGNLWFTNAGNGSIGNITTDQTATVSNFTGPGISTPYDITTGPDGNLWFTNSGNSSIGRITTAGVVTNFTDPSISFPTGITVGPDGALWFTNSGSSSIGRITTAGVVTKFTDATISGPRDITSGPDGALWFTNTGNSSIGRITTAGVVTKITSASISAPRGIVLGPDNALWFTNGGNSTIGRVTVQVPGMPTSPQAVAYGNKSALLGWTAPASNGSPITSYVVRPYISGVAQKVRVLNSSSNLQLLKNLQNGKSYQFTIAAQNAGGTGPPSVKTAPIIVGAPQRVAKPTAVKVASGSLKVTFTAPNNNGSPITGYTATCASSNGGVTKSKTGTATSLTVTGLTAGKSYVCAVSATNSRGTGPSSFPSDPVTA